MFLHYLYSNFIDKNQQMVNYYCILVPILPKYFLLANNDFVLKPRLKTYNFYLYIIISY